MIVYIAIGVSFLINLIITLAFRIADKKDRTLKNVNIQIKNFRTEVNATVARVNATAKDCEVNIQSRVDQANAANSKLAESLDMLMVHQKELSDLEYICKSYKIALEKLKGQTEQAEARILAVQAEVRKAESINSFTLQFQSDAERLTNQMQDLKAEYVRLVASTEQSLRNAGQSQLDENNKNLIAFSDAIDRARGDLIEFANNEKIAIKELFNHQEMATEEALGKLDQRKNEINLSIEEATNALDSYKKDLEESTAALATRKDEVIKSAEEILSRFKGDLENTGEATANTLESRIRDREDELNSSFEQYSEKLQEKESAVDKLLDEIDTRKTVALSSMDSAIENKKKDIDSAIAMLGNEKEIYVARSHEVLDNVFRDSLVKAQDQIASLKDLSNVAIQHIFDKIGEAKETYLLVTSSSEDKLSQLVKTLSELEDKLKNSRSIFNTLCEEITTKRQELYDINKESEDANDKLDKAYAELEKAKEDTQQAKEARINEEARVVRLKFQQSALRKEQKEDSRKSSDVDIESADTSIHKKPEEMIQEFPDDIEYVDLSDDEE